MKELPKADGEVKGAPALAEDKMQGVMSQKRSQASQKRAEMRKSRKRKKKPAEKRREKKRTYVGNHGVLTEAERKEMLKQRYTVKPVMNSELQREIDEEPWCAIDNDAIWE